MAQLNQECAEHHNEVHKVKSNSEEDSAPTEIVAKHLVTEVVGVQEHDVTD